MTESHMIIWLSARRFDFEGCDLIWIYDDLIYDLNNSEVSVIWADWSQTQCSTTSAGSYMPIRKANSIPKTHVEQKLSKLWTFLRRRVVCSAWNICNLIRDSPITTLLTVSVHIIWTGLNYWEMCDIDFCLSATQPRGWATYTPTCEFLWEGLQYQTLAVAGLWRELFFGLIGKLPSEFSSCLLRFNVWMRTWGSWKRGMGGGYEWGIVVWGGCDDLPHSYV